MSGLGIGERLIEARESSGRTLEDAERDTRISRRYLQALESEQFDVIPAPVYARGFLRSYSQYLGLNPQDLLERFPRDDLGPPTTTARPSMDNPISPVGPARPRWTQREEPLRPEPVATAAPREPVIGIDIGVPHPARRIRSGPGTATRPLIVAVIAIVAIAAVVGMALIISSLGGDGSEGPGPGGATGGEATEEPTQATQGSGLDVTPGIIPSVVGEPVDVARLAIEEAGFRVTEQFDVNADVPRGVVYDQAPAAGSEQEPGREVFIAVSEGPE